jgi:succinate dehydrogenase/fumarate reductase flavoprotein subunit
MTRPTVIVVGAGNAALVSALSAHESGAKVTICEAANEEDMGGNSRFTFASFRFGSQGVDDVKALVPAMSDADTEIVRNAPYTPQDFFNHLMTLSHMRADPELCEMLAKASYDNAGLDEAPRRRVGHLHLRSPQGTAVATVAGKRFCFRKRQGADQDPALGRAIP